MPDKDLLGAITTIVSVFIGGALSTLTTYYLGRIEKRRLAQQDAMRLFVSLHRMCNEVLSISNSILESTQNREPNDHREFWQVIQPIVGLGACLPRLENQGISIITEKSPSFVIELLELESGYTFLHDLVFRYGVLRSDLKPDTMEMKGGQIGETGFNRTPANMILIQNVRSLADALVNTASDLTLRATKTIEKLSQEFLKLGFHVPKLVIDRSVFPTIAEHTPPHPQP